MKVKVGLDLGSTAIKVVLTRQGEMLWQGQTPTAPGQQALAQMLVNKGLTQLGLKSGELGPIAATGYGRGLCGLAELKVDEISANAAGIYALSGGQARAVINIGGQDVKVIRMDEQGRVSDFKMNDKCAAGTGRFFELTARLLDTPLAEFTKISKSATEKVALNSTCVVFAESEMVSLMAKGTKKGDIIKALHCSVARRVASMLQHTDLKDGLWLDGGPALNEALVMALEDELMTDVYVLEKPQFTVAYGAALALE